MLLTIFSPKEQLPDSRFLSILPKNQMQRILQSYSMDSSNFKEGKLSLFLNH